MPLSLTLLTCLLRDWRLHLCGPVSCQLEQLQTSTAQRCSDTQYAAKNGQREADRWSPGSRSTQLSTIEGRNRDAALNWANVTFCWARWGTKRLRGNFGFKLRDACSRGCSSGLCLRLGREVHNRSGKQEAEVWANIWRQNPTRFIYNTDYSWDWKCNIFLNVIVYCFIWP